MKNRKTILIIIGHLVAILVLLQDISAQDAKGYIYGKVYTRDQTYEGSITWGKEETFWHNYFNASKTNKSSYQQKAGEKEQDLDWKEFDWSFRAIWEDKATTRHQYSSQFGDISVIENHRRDEVLLTLKNGLKMALDGRGYNDVGATIEVNDEFGNTVRVDWERVDRVEFFSAPNSFKIRNAKPIYGKVETLGKGSFTGFVQWDHDERLLTHKLDGDIRGGDVSISFESIFRIERLGKGCEVVLKDGREFYLTGSNDVDESNRGVIVYVPDLGRVDISWRHFRSLEMITTEKTGPGYDDYPKPEGIRGSVLTVKNEQHSGKIIYDLDEEWELETLDAKDDGVSYEIPFRFLDKITPKNYSFSQIYLKNGNVLLLGDARDVDNNNDGLIILDATGRQEAYIMWNRIVEIKFD